MLKIVLEDPTPKLPSAVHQQHFEREYLGMPVAPDPAVLAARRLVEEYYERCDRFDTLACSGKNHRGEPVPATGGEYFSINDNAKKVRAEIEDRAAKGSIPPNILKEEFISYGKRTR